MERSWAPVRPGLSLLLTVTAGVNLLPFAALLAFSLQGGGGFFSIGSDGLTQLINTSVGVVCWPWSRHLGDRHWLAHRVLPVFRQALAHAGSTPALATPAYLQAAVITDLGAREGTQIYGLSWCVAVLILANLPYVVLLARDNFRLSGRRQLEASRSLGLGAWKSFFRVSLPLAIPAITAGIALAGMEVVNEYGADSGRTHAFTDCWNVGKAKMIPQERLL